MPVCVCLSLCVLFFRHVVAATPLLSTFVFFSDLTLRFPAAASALRALNATRALCFSAPGCICYVHGKFSFFFFFWFPRVLLPVFRALLSVVMVSPLPLDSGTPSLACRAASVILAAYPWAHTMCVCLFVPVRHASCRGAVAGAALLPPRNGRELRAGGERRRRGEVIFGPYARGVKARFCAGVQRVLLGNRIYVLFLCRRELNSTGKYSWVGFCCDGFSCGVRNGGSSFCVPCLGGFPCKLRARRGWGGLGFVVFFSWHI